MSYEEARHVRFWHKADIQLSPGNVRFWGQSGHDRDAPRCLLLTQSERGVLFGAFVRIRSQRTALRPSNYQTSSQSYDFLLNDASRRTHYMALSIADDSAFRDDG